MCRGSVNLAKKLVCEAGAHLEMYEIVPPASQADKEPSGQTDKRHAQVEKDSWACVREV